MRRLLAGLMTVGLMALLVWSSSRRSDNGPILPDRGTPRIEAPALAESHPAEARVQALLESARVGNVPSYLDAFSGPLKGRLEQQVAERGAEAFAGELRAASSSRKSHAVFAAEPEGPTAAIVTVEAVYLDRNERQRYRVEQDGPGASWRVTEVTRASGRAPSAKFGAPATYQAPEAIPVQGDGLTVETGEETLP